MNRILSVAFISFCLFFSFSVAATEKIQAVQVAQNSIETTDKVVEKLMDEPLNIIAIAEDLVQIESTIKKNTISLKGSQEYIKKLSQYQTSLTAEKNIGTNQLENLNKKIVSLSSLTAEGEIEPEDITKQRVELNVVSDNIKSRIASADLALVKIEEINQLIMTLRNRELFDQILVQGDSILHWKTFVESIKNFAVFLYGVTTYPATWYQNLQSEQQTAVITQLEQVAGTGVVCLIAVLFLSWIIRRKFGYRKEIVRPNYSQKVVAAFFVLLARGIIPSTILGAAWFWLREHQELFSGAFGTVLRIGIVYLLYLFLSCAVVLVLFTPFRPRWRLIEVKNDKARSLSSALLFSIIIICLFSYFQVLAIQLEYSDDTIFALKMLANIMKAACIIVVTKRFLYNDRQLTDEELNEEDVQQLSSSSKISVLITLGTIIVLAFSFFGYVMLTEYILNRFISSILIIGVFYIIQKLLVVLFHQFMMRKFWMRNFRITRKQTEKFEFWFGFFLTPILVIISAFILLFMWGVSVDILAQKAKNFLMGFDVGGMHVSVLSIFMGIGSFFVVLFIAKLVKGSITTGKLSKIEMDTSVRNSLAAGVGFIGVIMACLVGISVMGGSLKGLALMAGALSLGAGLGLQNIVNNFVSGIILLFERPIKIGDWVIVKGEEGIVKQVNIRSTVIETFTRANVIIPNADILSNSLTNMTYKNKLGRIDIIVGVAYNSNIELVRSTLLAVAQNTKGIVSTPAPFVLIVDFTDYRVSFRLGCYTSDINNRASLGSVIREEILRKFQENNIEIPLPQRVMYVRQNNTDDTGFQLEKEDHIGELPDKSNQDSE